MTADVDARPSEEQLRQIIDDHSQSIYRVAISIVRDPGLAEDVAQETVIKVWESMGSYRGEAPLRNWILRIAHNTAVSLLRKLRDEAWDPSTLPETHGVVDVERRVQGRDDLVALGEALAGLDELSRSIVVLREIEGLTYEEISESLEISLPTVKTRLLRARRSLQNSVRSGEPGAVGR